MADTVLEVTETRTPTATEKEPESKFMFRTPDSSNVTLYFRDQGEWERDREWGIRKPGRERAVTLFAKTRPDAGTLIQISNNDRFRVVDKLISLEDDKKYRDSSIFVERVPPADFEREVTSGKLALGAGDVLTTATLQDLSPLLTKV